MNNPASQNRIEKTKQRKFVLYKERLDRGLSISFNYPEELKVDRIKNGICVHDGNITEESEIISKAKWSIWFYNDQEESIENLISTEKLLLKVDYHEVRDSFYVDNTNGIKVNYINKDNQIIKQNIYLTKHDTLIKINNNGSPNKDFEIFSHSIRIEKE